AQPRASEGWLLPTCMVACRCVSGTQRPFVYEHIRGPAIVCSAAPGMRQCQSQHKRPVAKPPKV
ncbi:hypothetical protein GGI22_004027, partial [Coemansia erecta]